MPFADLIREFDLDVRGVLHLGAHLGEEAEVYWQDGVSRVYWVEANPELMIPLKYHVRGFPGQSAYEGLLADEPGKEMTFHVSSCSTTPEGSIDHQASSLFELGQHVEFAPDVSFGRDLTLVSTTVDELVAEHGMDFNFMNLDLQGAELLALRGATTALEACDAVYTEVNRAEVYLGCAQIEEVDALLVDAGFEQVRCVWEHNAQTWGDAFYRRMQ